MADRMKAAVKEKPAPKSTVVKQVPRPEPGPDEVRIRIKVASICGTDVHIYDWDAWAQARIKTPLIQGHEFAGEIEKLGANVTGLREGDYVSAEGHIACGRCYMCRTGNAHVCKTVSILGIDRGGSFAEYLTVPASNVIVNDDDLPPELATMQDPLGNAVYTSMNANPSGKAIAINQGVARARGGILVFSDAATLFRSDALKKLVRHFAEPRVGVVCGALRFEASVESRQTEGVYWRYESMLRLMESRLGVTLTASGAIYAMRRECFVPFPTDTLVEDLLVPVNARRAGFRVLYDPDAIATDFAPSTVAGEFARRVRIATGSFRALGEILWGPLDPMTAFAFVSHKLLRWILPFLLLGMLVSSASLWAQPVYRALLMAQLVFYAWAAVGCVFRRRVQGIRYALMAYYLLAMHLAFLVGFMHFLTGHRGAEWRRVS